ncbi:hypothetical protein L861_12590 [Litchfieldella anticariensis FP35 = DSM 16096]|uniref:Phosphohistidine phosphatase n=1 Tax=Litchfieldella anticariensis (strain DSM 16096 / CECT 5854 / CIP 108499 / LMG 22089 / FP35) TaxID=1121939 RepID=S2KLT6_LITA3|nr:phosphohistidine phosphatase SixA [Halomonas anticariensis]EPC01403.1 hypothetical protein L861_12590 [Halomonas anticariensis FP35 = DSM 16096]
MSDRVMIMRHGKAKPGQPDADRELSERGCHDASRMGAWLAASLDEEWRRPLRVVASPFRRAQQTAILVAEPLGLTVETLELITPDDPVEPVIEWLLKHAAGTPWLLVSHMPLVGELTTRLVEGGRGQGMHFPTAAIASLEADVWAAGCARLSGFHTPADIS